MKLKQMVACILTLLLVVSLLPMTALADTITDNGPGAYREGISSGDTMNKNTGEVETNGGTIKQNIHVNGFSTSGIVHVNNGTIEENYGQVVENFKTVENNEVGGNVETNQDTGTIGTNNGNVNGNYGDIGTNNGTVHRNNGTIGTNNGTVHLNNGTIGTNNGSVEYNNGTVETNAIDGVLNNDNDGGAVAASNDDAIETPTEQPPVVAGVGTNFGTVHNRVDGNTYYGLSWGESVDKLNSIESFVLAGDTRNLDEIANGVNREGYKMTGYTAYSRKEGENVVIDDTAGYEMNAPTWLEILWQKLGGKSENKPTKTPVYTNLSGDQVKVGAFVSVNGCIFKIIEVNEDNIRVATVNQLPEKALTDMLGFLKQYLSDAQIAKFQSEPELLEEELVAKFFGGSNEHIAFYASRDLFA